MTFSAQLEAKVNEARMVREKADDVERAAKEKEDGVKEFLEGEVLFITGIPSGVKSGGQISRTTHRLSRERVKVVEVCFGMKFDGDTFWVETSNGKRFQFAFGPHVSLERVEETQAA